MADLDIEAMLEAPFKAAEAEKEREREPQHETAPAESSASRKEEESESKDKKKSESKDKDKKEKRRSRSRSRERHRDKDKKESRSKRRSRSRSKDRSHKRRRSRSRSRSRDRRRKSRSRSRDRKKRSRSRSRDRGGRDRERERERRRSRSRSRRERERTPEDPNKKKIREYIESLSPEEQKTLDDEIDRTERSLICMQLSVKLQDKDLLEFFMSNDILCRDARIIADRNSRRSKGIAYIELLKRDDIQRALALSGQKLMGVPIMVQYSQAEKNRQAGQTTVGPTKIYVASLHQNLAESDVKAIFAPFGDIEYVTLLKESNGRSRGMAYINYKKPDHAKLAIEQMNNFELAGMTLKVGWENERGHLDSVDDETDRGGVPLTAQSRQDLMQKLSQSMDGGMSMPAPVAAPAFVPAAVPVVVAPAVVVPPVLVPTPCLKLKNMFDYNKEDKDEYWAEDLKEDVEDECNNYGKVLHVHVDTESLEGVVYLRYGDAASGQAAYLKMHGRWFDGRSLIAEYLPEAAYQIRFPDAPKA